MSDLGMGVLCVFGINCLTLLFKEKVLHFVWDRSAHLKNANIKVLAWKHNEGFELII